jgi:hypothetical protein
MPFYWVIVSSCTTIGRRTFIAGALRRDVNSANIRVSDDKPWPFRRTLGKMLAPRRLMRNAGMPTLLLLVLAASASSALATGVETHGVVTAAVSRHWHGCSRHPRRVRHLQVSYLTCAKAIKAIKRGKFESPPGGPTFSTPGFRCHWPVGPPLDGPRFTVCRRHSHAFRFYSLAEPA